MQLVQRTPFMTSWGHSDSLHLLFPSLFLCCPSRQTNSDKTEPPLGYSTLYKLERPERQFFYTSSTQCWVSFSPIFSVTVVPGGPEMPLLLCQVKVWNWAKYLVCKLISQPSIATFCLKISNDLLFNYYHYLIRLCLTVLTDEFTLIQ